MHIMHIRINETIASARARSEGIDEMRTRNVRISNTPPFSKLRRM